MSCRSYGVGGIIPQSGVYSSTTGGWGGAVLENSPWRAEQNMCFMWAARSKEEEGISLKFIQQVDHSSSLEESE